MRHLETHLNLKGSIERRLVLQSAAYYINLMDITSLRQTLRQQRRQLSVTERCLFSQQLTTRLMQSPLLTNSKAIACYWPFDGEIETQMIIEQLWSFNKQCYLPALSADTKLLHFIEYTKSSSLQLNHFGITEPTNKERAISPEKLDLVLLPLVGFDESGNRLGTGGGYYDRTFAFVNGSPRPAKPLLIGLAYDFQKITTLQPQHWDITLDGIITEKQLYLTSLGNTS